MRSRVGSYAADNFDVSVATNHIPASLATKTLFWSMLTAVWISQSSARAHGELDIRIAAASRAIAAESNNASLYLQRGELYREHKDWPAAAADYDRAALLDPKAALVDFYRGRMLADAGRLPEAVKCFDQFLSRTPNDGNGFIERARVKTRTADLHAAVSDFTRGIELVNEPQPEFFLERSQTLVALGETNHALAGLDEGIKKLGPVVTLQVYAVELELAAKNFEAALARLNTIIPQANRKENWLAQRGEIELQASRHVAARASFEAALRAIDILPARLQLNRPMAELRAHVNQMLATTTNAPTKAATNSLK